MTPTILAQLGIPIPPGLVGSKRGGDLFGNGPKALVGAALDGRAADNVAALVVYLHRHPEDGENARGCALS